MAWVEKVEKSWRIRWREGGKVRSSPRYGRKIEALADLPAAEAREAASARTEANVLQALPWAQAVAAWAKDNGGSPRYVTGSVAALTRLGDRMGWRTLANVTAADVRGRVKIGEWRLLKTLLSWGLANGQPVDAQVLHLPPPKRVITPDPDLITEAQAAAAIADAWAWAPGNGAIVLLVARYGHRPESLVRVRCADLGESITLRVKSGDTVKHRLAADDADLLHPLVCGRKDDEFAFVNHLGRAWATGQQFAAWYYHQIGIRAHPHDPGVYACKRLAMTRLLAAGLDVATIASVTGHRTPQTILRYARSSKERQDRAIGVLESTPLPVCTRVQT